MHKEEETFDKEPKTISKTHFKKDKKSEG